MSDYIALRPCVKRCFWLTAGTRTRDLFGASLSCELTTTDSRTLTVAMNDCYCRADLQLDAYQSLSRCVDSKCTSNSNDLLSAASAYSNYCTANGYLQDTVVEATTTGAGGQGGSGGRTGTGTDGWPVRTGGPGDDSGAEGMAAGKALLGSGVLMVSPFL
jgi:hypothetical protein